MESITSHNVCYTILLDSDFEGKKQRLMPAAKINNPLSEMHINQSDLNI